MPTLAAPHLLRARGRRHAWVGAGRAHIAVRLPHPDDDARFRARLGQALREHPAVRWVEPVGMVGRVVVALGGGDESVAEVVDAIEEVEAEFGLARGRPGDGEQPHPADPAVIARATVKVGASAVGLGLASLRSFVPPARLPWVGYAATGAAFLEHAPRLHRAADRLLGPEPAEVVLAAADAIGQGLTASPLGPLVDLAHRNSQLRALRARRRLWEEHETTLYAAGPTGHPHDAPRQPRPRPMPPGVVERFADRALLASIGGAGVAIAASGALPFGAGLLYAGLPKAAVYGRDAFAAHVGRILASRGLLLPLDIEALRRLDRVDCLMIDERILVTTVAGRREPELRLGARQVIDAAHRAGLYVVVAGGQTRRIVALRPDWYLPGGDDLVASIRRMQDEDAVVLLAAPGGSPALPTADVSLGLRFGAGVPALQADVIAVDDDLTHVSALVTAAAMARRASRQDTVVARLGAVAGVVAGLLGLPVGASNRALDAVNAATVVALANSYRLANRLQAESFPGVPAAEPEAAPALRVVA